MNVLDLVTAPTVISIDPGGTTGWSLMCVHPHSLTDPDTPILSNIDYWVHGEISTEDTPDGERKCVNTLMRTINDWPGCCVVIEDFILRKMLADRKLLSPVRITAALEYALAEAGHSVFTRQGQDVLTTANDERMKNWGLYKRAGGQQHARDADRHSISYLRKLKGGPGLRGTSFPHLYSVRGDYKRG